jgi:hypothetical protein
VEGTGARKRHSIESMLLTIPTRAAALQERRYLRVFRFQTSPGGSRAERVLLRTQIPGTQHPILAIGGAAYSETGGATWRSVNRFYRLDKAEGHREVTTCPRKTGFSCSSQKSTGLNGP